MRYRAFHVLLAAMLALSAEILAVDFNYTTNNGTITITEYTGSDDTVIIPGMIDGMPVTVLGNAAFSYNSLSHVVIPSSVIHIENAAFYSCANLAGVNIPDSVVSLGSSVFYQCTGLTNVILPDGISSIGNSVFNQCTGLTNAILPVGIAGIGEEMFRECSSLASIVIPEGATNIGMAAFLDCTSLTGVVLPDSVTTMGESAFGSCRSMTNVVLSSNLSSIPGWAFYSCQSLTDIRIPDSVRSIGVQAFGNCQKLRGAIVGSGVSRIERMAFETCAKLAGMCFRGEKPVTGSDVFLGTDNVVVYYVSETNGWESVFAGRDALFWNPTIQVGDTGFGVRTNGFGFGIAGTTNIPILVEASSDLPGGAWLPLLTNSLVGGACDFTDTNAMNYPNRSYRIRWPY